MKNLKKHEQEYFHIPKKIMYPFIILWIPICLAIYLVWIIGLCVFSIAGVIIFTVLGWTEDGKEYLDFIYFKDIGQFLPIWCKK